MNSEMWTAFQGISLLVMNIWT